MWNWCIDKARENDGVVTQAVERYLLTVPVDQQIKQKLGNNLGRIDANNFKQFGNDNKV